ncbi:PilW family protein [Thalassotalea maritima]|uniref:PilW family protein n=1 Tax=Thalassotalea maritima TaxID=3242416 RepID=UPI00352915EA
MNIKGYSLLELMIAMVVSLFLLTGLISVFTNVRATTAETTAAGMLQENGRFAVSVLSNELLRAGFLGESTTIQQTQQFTQIPVAINANKDCIGDGVNNASFPNTDGQFRMLWGATATTISPINCISDAKIGSDILQIKRVLAQPIDEADIQATEYYIKANLGTGAMFKGSSPVPNLDDATIWQYQHHVYYIKDETLSGQVIPVLMHGRLDNDEMVFEPMIDGIENIHFMYGVDTDGDDVVNVFLSAANMPMNFWDQENGIRIIAARIFVLVRDIQADNNYRNTNTYVMGDSSVTVDDNYRRVLFNSTVNLFNSGVQRW